MKCDDGDGDGDGDEDDNGNNKGYVDLMSMSALLFLTSCSLFPLP